MTETATQRILLVEDEDAVREVVSYNLEREGFAVTGVATGGEAFAASPAEFGAIILDWMLPDMSGLDVMKRLRAEPTTKSVPIIMLTARSAETDKVLGLEFGADDYVSKPFGVAELVARVRALLRRAARSPAAGEVLRGGGVTVEPDTGRAWLGGRELRLTRREFDLLAFFVSNRGGVFTRGQLLDRVWGQDYAGGERTVDQHVAQLRALLGDDPSESRLIQTVRGRGYRFVAD
jgi:DNA-binding response OmpR family regulator